MQKCLTAGQKCTEMSSDLYCNKCTFHHCHCVPACARLPLDILCCQIYAVPFHPSHLFGIPPQTHGILLSYELWVSVTQHCMACLFSPHFNILEHYSVKYSQRTPQFRFDVQFNPCFVRSLREGETPKWLFLDVKQPKTRESLKFNEETEMIRSRYTET